VPWSRSARVALARETNTESKRERGIGEIGRQKQDDEERYRTGKTAIPGSYTVGELAEANGPLCWSFLAQVKTTWLGCKLYVNFDSEECKMPVKGKK